jgi:glucokinase
MILLLRRIAIGICIWLQLQCTLSTTSGILRTKASNMRTVLAADIGGTYTRMSLVEIGRPWRNLSIMRSNEKFTNSEFASIDAIITSFLENVPLEYARPSSACFAVAGPCIDDVGTLTNGGNWIVDGHSIADKYGMNSVKVVNDFVACGYGLLTLNDDEDCCIIQVVIYCLKFSRGLSHKNTVVKILIS